MTENLVWNSLHILSKDEVEKVPNTDILSNPAETISVSPPLFVRDLSKASYNNNPAPFIRTLNSRTSLKVPSLNQITLKNQTVFGSHHFHAFIGQSNDITSRGVSSTGSMLDYHIKAQNTEGFQCPKIRKHENKFQITYDTTPECSVTKITEKSYFCSPREPANWGMWLVQGIPDITNFLQKGKQSKLFGWFPASGFQQKIAKSLGASDESLISQEPWKTYAFEEITLLQYEYDNSLCLGRFQKSAINSFLDRYNTKKRSFPEKIFISRKSLHQSYRSLMNEEELCVGLSNIGFTIIEPQKFDIETQINIFRSAKVVVGLGGAGMFNTVFCTPGTLVVSVESSTNFVLHHAELFASLGHQYGIIFGERDKSDSAPVHYRWSINVKDTLEILKHYL